MVLEEGPKITSENNVVNTILVEFRAFDTLGELAVLGMAGIADGRGGVVDAAVAALPAVRGRCRRRAEFAADAQAGAVDDAAAVGLSLIVLYRGGNEPGGGFNAALIGASALMLKYLSQPDDRPLMGRNIPYLFSGFGVIVAIGIGFVGYVEGSFLAPLHGTVAGQHLTTAMIFDVGVYLAVLGIVATALNHLGGPTRPGSPKTDDELGPRVAHRTGCTFRRGRSPARPVPRIPRSGIRRARASRMSFTTDQAGAFRRPAPVPPTTRRCGHDHRPHCGRAGRRRRVSGAATRHGAHHHRDDVHLARREPDHLVGGRGRLAAGTPDGARGAGDGRRCAAAGVRADGHRHHHGRDGFMLAMAALGRDDDTRIHEDREANAQLSTAGRKARRLRPADAGSGAGSIRHGEYPPESPQDGDRR